MCFKKSNNYQFLIENSNYKRLFYCAAFTKNNLITKKTENSFFLTKCKC